MNYERWRAGQLVVHFTHGELDALWKLAQDRQQVKESDPHARDKRVDGALDNTVMHLLGLAAEAAVAHVLGVPMDTRVLQSGSKKNLRLPDGRELQVQWRQKWMLWRPGEFTADIAVVVNPWEEPRKLHTNKRSDMRHAELLKNRRVVIIGWCDQDTWHKWKFEQDFGYGPSMCLRPGNLSPLMDLIAPPAEQLTMF